MYEIFLMERETVGGHEAYDAIADDYDRLRPGYPADFVKEAVGRSGMPIPGIVADLAAGTGKLASVLSQLGLNVVGVEPLARMRARIPRGPRLAVAGGVAERLPFRDGALDAVVAGQAWHWFAPGAATAEAHRVLRPGGLLMIVTNVFDTSAEWAGKIERIRRGRPVAGADGPFAGDDRRWLAGGELRGRHVHTVARESVVDLVLTTSSLAAAPAARRRTVAEEIIAVGREHGLLDSPRVRVPFLLRARWAMRAA